MHNKNFTSHDAGQYVLVTNTGGQTLGYSSKSGVTILVVDGFAFKVLIRTGNSINMKTGDFLQMSAPVIWRHI